MAEDKKYYTLVCKLPVECQGKLDALAKMYGTTRAGFIRSVICTEFDKINNNAEAQALLDKMKEIAQQFENMTGMKIN